MTTGKSPKRAAQTAFRSIEEFKRRYFPAVVAAEMDREKDSVTLGISGASSSEALRQLTASLVEPKGAEAGENAGGG